MRTLIYKRTHQGDPDMNGWFGHNGCMGKLRCSDFHAVIGIGGSGKEPIQEGIARKLNWIGLGAHPEDYWVKGAPVITFEHFCLFENSGENLDSIAPNLSSRFYAPHPPRRLFSDSAQLKDAERAEIEIILKMAASAASSRPFRKPYRSMKYVKMCLKCPSARC